MLYRAIGRAESGKVSRGALDISTNSRSTDVFIKWLVHTNPILKSQDIEIQLMRYERGRGCMKLTRLIQSGILMMALLAWSHLASGGEIHEAVKRGDLAKVQVLLKENPALAVSEDETGWTPLHLAAQKGFNDIAALLLANHAEPNAKSKRGDTPLHWAAGNGHKETVALLLANHADVNAQDNGGWTPLHMAARSGSKEVVQLLLAHKAKVDLKDQDGLTPLKRALLQGQQGMVKLLRQYEQPKMSVPEKRHTA